MFRLVAVLALVGCSLGQLINRGPHTAFNRFSPSTASTYNFNKYNPQPRFFTTPSPAPSVTASAEAFSGPAVPQFERRYNNYARSNEQDAVIVRSDNDVSPDGHFQYSYETSNGIAAHAVGSPRNFGGNPPVVPSVIEGSFSWVAPDGTPVSIGYVADENGYRAVGDAIPTPPPIPQAILRSLQYQGININKK